MIAAAAAVELRRPAELRRRQHQRLSQQTALMQVLD
jgi:hypothetical protein